MTDRFKEADEALHNLMLIALQVRNSSVRAGVYETTIRRYLILAQEAEQLRKERDELAQAVVYGMGDNRYYQPQIDNAIELAKKVSNENGNA